MAYPYDFTGYGYAPNYMQQPRPMPQPMQGGVVCRPVSSKEEAKGMQVQFDGSLYAFINLNAGEIYTKQFNFNTGSMDFETYTKAVPPPAVSYATTAELEQIRQELAGLKNARMEGVAYAE